MNKYIIGAVVLIIALVIILVSLGSSGNKATEVAQTTSAITVPESSYDFGEIDIFGGKVSTEYLLKNEGAEDVLILSAITSCMCTEGKIDDLRFSLHESSGGVVTIPAGGEKTLIAIYDPLAHGPDSTGKVKRELSLKTNSSVAPEVQVTFAANVVKN